jgi:hypothetical protein
MKITSLANNAEHVSRLRTLVLLVVGLDSLLVVLRVLLYLPIFKEQDSTISVAEPLVLLLVYAGIIWWSTQRPSRNLYLALSTGITVGLLTGIAWMVSLLIETFVELSGIFALVVSATLMLSSFLGWGIAGLRGARKTQSFGLGMLATLWSSMVAILMLVALGWLLTYIALPQLSNQMINDPDFLRSHWTDRQAFAIANTFDAGFSHLLGAPVVGSIFGLVGSMIGTRSPQGRQKAF